jgi:anaerobic ribonucleoside-triphosphate reductase
MNDIKEIDKQIEEIELKMNDRELCMGSASTITRITGYFRPLENWNTGKQQEYMERLEVSLILRPEY